MLYVSASASTYSEQQLPSNQNAETIGENPVPRSLEPWKGLPWIPFASQRELGLGEGGLLYSAALVLPPEAR